ncbi:MAG: thioredoxin family protein [Saprospiraceae bacterium]
MLQSLFSKSTLLMLAIVISANLISCAQTPAKDANNGYKAEQEGWLVNLDEAYALSKKTNKPIMANFTGSDWCGWCKRLSAAVFVKDDFKAWAKKNVILLELDFPRGKAIPDAIRTQNANLQQAFQVSGYPTIWVFDLEKDKKTNQYQINALGKTGYTATVQEFTSGVDQMIAKRAAK